MLSTTHARGIVFLWAASGLVLFADRSTLLPFSANAHLGVVFEGMPLVEVMMLVSSCSLGAASTSFSGHVSSSRH